jgi:hypothetical protein
MAQIWGEDLKSPMEPVLNRGEGSEKEIKRE